MKVFLNTVTVRAFRLCLMISAHVARMRVVDTLEDVFKALPARYTVME
jgi:hypothetical protein